MRLTAIILILFWQCCCCVPLLNAADADTLWAQAVQMAKQREMDFAFINFRMIVDTYPDSTQSPAAQFDLGEYYFLENYFTLAIAEFEGIYTKHPRQKESMVALAYLYKIAQMKGQKDQMSRYQKQIISSYRAAFIFKDSRSFEYLSGFQHKHKLVFYIDRIEVFADGKLFVEVPC